MESELALLHRVRTRDPEAIRSIVDANLSHVLRAARGAGLSPEEAEDVTQDTFLTFLATIERFEGRSKIRTWLFGILFRKISERRRGRRRDGELEDIDSIVESRFDADGRWIKPPRGPDDDLFDAQIAEHLDACLDELPDRHRTGFYLREVEGLSTDDICSVLEVTRSNLGVILFRARNALRECLEARGFRGGSHA